MPEPRSFGAFISERRKQLNLSQKELAALVLREEDQRPISPQYLNDIERDRRNPSSDHLIRQFARALQVEDQADYLFFLAGTIPDEYRKTSRRMEDVVEILSAFRRLK